MVGKQITINTKFDDAIMGTVRQFDNKKIEFDEVTIYNKATGDTDIFNDFYMYWEDISSLSFDEEDDEE